MDSFYSDFIQWKGNKFRWIKPYNFLIIWANEEISFHSNELSGYISSHRDRNIYNESQSYESHYENVYFDSHSLDERYQRKTMKKLTADRSIIDRCDWTNSQSIDTSQGKIVLLQERIMDYESDEEENDALDDLINLATNITDSSPTVRGERICNRILKINNNFHWLLHRYLNACQI